MPDSNAIYGKMASWDAAPLVRDESTDLLKAAISKNISQQQINLQAAQSASQDQRAQMQFELGMKQQQFAEQQANVSNYFKAKEFERETERLRRVREFEDEINPLKIDVERQNFENAKQRAAFDKDRFDFDNDQRTKMEAVDMIMASVGADVANIAADKWVSGDGEKEVVSKVNSLVSKYADQGVIVPADKVKGMLKDVISLHKSNAAVTKLASDMTKEEADNDALYAQLRPHLDDAQMKDLLVYKDGAPVKVGKFYKLDPIKAADRAAEITSAISKSKSYGEQADKLAKDLSTETPLLVEDLKGLRDRLNEDLTALDKRQQELIKSGGSESDTGYQELQRQKVLLRKNYEESRKTLREANEQKRKEVAGLREEAAKPAASRVKNVKTPEQAKAETQRIGTQTAMRVVSDGVFTRDEMAKILAANPEARAEAAKGNDLYFKALRMGRDKGKAIPGL